MKNNKAKQLIENALNSLTESLENGQSDELKKYLQTMSRFHQYSLRNVMLIALQNPQATRVAGFHTPFVAFTSTPNPAERQSFRI